MGLKICSQQAGNPGESVFSSSLSPKAWSARELMVQSQSKGWMAWDPGRIHVSVEAWKQEEKKNHPNPHAVRQKNSSYTEDIHSFLLFLFCLDEAWTH